MLRRTIHPQVRVLDEKQGLVEYVASSEALDSYQEIISAAGWRFDDFEKNAPFVDSHNYNSIDCLLGRVTDFRVKGRQLVEQVKWAIDVPTNTLALKGFQMTAAGYLKAVSVGFIPQRSVTPFDRDPAAWRAACEEMKIDPNGDCRCIYLEQQQKELSACVIGANPDALAGSYAAGIFSDRDVATLAQRWPEFGRNFERATTSDRHCAYSFSPEGKAAVSKMLGALDITPEPPKKTMKTLFNTPQFGHSLPTVASEVPLTGDLKRAHEEIEHVRRSDNEAEIERAVRAVFATERRVHQNNYGDPIQKYLDAEPSRRFYWNGIARLLGAKYAQLTPKLSPLELQAVQKAVSGIDVQGQLGIGLLFAFPVVDVWDLLQHYGAYKRLGLRKMIGQWTKYASVTSFPDAAFITPNNQGKTTIPADTSLAGTNRITIANTIACLVVASWDWVLDEALDMSDVLLSKMMMALAGRIDYGAFQGNGADDQQNGCTLGLFTNNQIENIYASAGKNQVAALERGDLLNALDALNPAALQRMEDQPPRWYWHPSFISKLLRLKEGTGPNYLLKTPAETQGEWHLMGFPVTWAAKAPSDETALGAPVAMFGNPDAYLVGLHENFELMSADGTPSQQSATILYRALGRGQSVTRDTTGFKRFCLSRG